MVVKGEDLIKGITTEELVAELNRRKELEIDKQIDIIREAINTLKMLDIRVVEIDSEWDFKDIDYEHKNKRLVFQFTE